MGLLPYDIYYENSRGERLCLSTPPFVMTRSDLFDRKWQLTTAARPLSEGARLIGRRRPCDEKSMTVEVVADTPEELSARLCELCDIFDKDIHAATAGRLYVNGQYLACWCTACVKDLSCDFTSRASVRLSVYPEHPAWCTERRYSFSADLSETDEDESDGHDYPYAYPYRYGSGRRSLSICNEHFAPAPIRDRSVSPEQLASAAQSVGFTGIGLYDASAGNFVHVDIRPVPYFWKTTSKNTVSVSGHGGKKGICPYTLSTSTLRRGSVGDSVRAAQWMLTNAGYPCAVDGKFGVKTEAAVKAIQADMLLVSDGIIGPRTRTMLSEVSA